MTKKVFLFAFILLISKMGFSGTLPCQKRADIIFSDIHLHPGDLDKKSEKDGSIALLLYKKQMDDMRRRMAKAVKDGDADCFNVIINGDPYNRSPSPTERHPGFEAQKPSEKKRLIKQVANDIRTILCGESGNNQKVKIDCQLGGKSGEHATVQFTSNIGDHEIPKLKGRDEKNKEDERQYMERVINELPPNAKLEMKKWQSSQKGNPSIKEFHYALEFMGPIKLNKQKGSFRWPNGDDVQAITSVGQEIAQSWVNAGFYVPKRDDGSFFVDPRICIPIKGPDGSVVLVSHVDKAVEYGDRLALTNQYDEQKHEEEHQASVLKRSPDIDPCNDPQYSGLRRYKGDSHIERVDLATGMLMRGNKDLSTALQATVGIEKTINPGTFGSSLRQPNGFNSYAMVFKDGSVDFRAASCGETPEEGLKWSRREIVKLIKAKGDDWERQEKKIKKDLESCYQQLSINPMDLFNKQFADRIEEIYKTQGIRGVILEMQKHGLQRRTAVQEFKRMIKCYNRNNRQI